jgi:hypothetical protein
MQHSRNIQPYTNQSLNVSFGIYEFSSISAHFAVISALLTFATSRFFLVLSSRSARRHLLTFRFAWLHIPDAFQRNPRAWHSSRIAITSSQPKWGVDQLLWQVKLSIGKSDGGGGNDKYLCCLWYVGEDASCLGASQRMFNVNCR